MAPESEKPLRLVLRGKHEMGARPSSQNLVVGEYDFDHHDNQDYRGGYVAYSGDEEMAKARARGVGQHLLLRDSLRLMQEGIGANLVIKSKDLSWKVHQHIVLERSSHLRVRFDERQIPSSGGVSPPVLELDTSNDNPKIMDAYLVWLYTRSFNLVTENILRDYGDKENLCGHIVLFRFCVRNNMTKRGGKEGEKDNDELIVGLSDKISQLVKEQVDYRAKSMLNAEIFPPRDPVPLIEAFSLLFGMEKGYERPGTPVSDLYKKVAGHVARRGALFRDSMTDHWERMLDYCFTFKDHLMEELLNSVNNQDLEAEFGNGYVDGYSQQPPCYT